MTTVYQTRTNLVRVMLETDSHFKISEEDGQHHVYHLSNSPLSIFPVISGNVRECKALVAANMLKAVLDYLADEVPQLHSVAHTLRELSKGAVS